MRIKVSISVVVFLVLVLAFANMYAAKQKTIPITDIRVNLDYENKEDYLDDFCYKAEASGNLFYIGLNNLLGFFPDLVGRVQSFIEKVGDWISNVFDWIRGIEPTPPSGPGGGGFRSR